MNRKTFADAAVLGAILGAALLLEGPVRADEAEAQSTRDETRRFDVSGFVDVLYAYNSNEPADHENFFPGVGTSAKARQRVRDQPRAGRPRRSRPSRSASTWRWASATRRRSSTPPRSIADDLGATWSRRRSSTRRKSAAACSSRAGSTRVTSDSSRSRPRTTGTTRAPGSGELSPYYQTGVKLAYPLGRALVDAGPRAQRLAGDRGQQPRQEPGLAVRLRRRRALLLVQRHRRTGAAGQRRRPPRRCSTPWCIWKATPGPQPRAVGRRGDARSSPIGDDAALAGDRPVRPLRSAGFAHGVRPARRVLRRRGRRDLGHAADAARRSRRRSSIGRSNG